MGLLRDLLHDKYLFREVHKFDIDTGNKYADILTNAIVILTEYDYDVVYIFTARLVGKDKVIYIQKISKEKGCVGSILNETAICNSYWSGIAIRGDTISVYMGKGNEMYMLLYSLYTPENCHKWSHEINNIDPLYQNAGTWVEVKFDKISASELNFKLSRLVANKMILDIEANEDHNIGDIIKVENNTYVYNGKRFVIMGEDLAPLQVSVSQDGFIGKETTRKLQDYSYNKSNVNLDKIINDILTSDEDAVTKVDMLREYGVSLSYSQIRNALRNKYSNKQGGE